MKKILTLLLIIVVTASLVACGKENQASLNPQPNKSTTEKAITDNKTTDETTKASSKTETLTNNNNNNKEDQSVENADKITDFAIKLLNKSIATSKKKTNHNQTNILISPVSIMSALGMIENGADGNTLKQFEQVLDLNLADTNKLFSDYINNINKDPDKPVNIANSIWLNNNYGIELNKDFLQKNAAAYQPEIFKADFSEKTKAAINNWVSKKTNNMINKVIDKLSNNHIIYLINALYFIDDWEVPYATTDIRPITFTTEQNQSFKIDALLSAEDSYLKNENYTGIKRKYKHSYSFIALLPKADSTVEEALANFSTTELNDLIANPQYEQIHAYIPMFKVKHNENLNESLTALGLKDAFNSTANFNKIGKNIYISKVIHKTFIDVNAKGTKAAAFSAVIAYGSRSPETDQPKIIKLDRPFIYIIYDDKNNCPLFIGTMMNPLIM